MEKKEKGENSVVRKFWCVTSPLKDIVHGILLFETFLI